MKDEIKEKLLKRIEEYSRFPYKPVRTPTIKEIYEIMLKQHEETSKAKDEEFIKLMIDIQKEKLEYNSLSVYQFIEEIKQKLEKKE